ncbi:MAG: hypothetical protein WCY32_13665 [Burkholderiaceae bacterium]
MDLYGLDLPIFAVFTLLVLFVIEQQRASTSPENASQALRPMFAFSAAAGALAALGFLLYFGWYVSWLGSAVLLLGAALVAGGLATVSGRIAPEGALTIGGMALWPACAAFLFSRV